MGLFKNMRDLTKQAQELQENMDVGAQLTNAQKSMAQANQMMAEQTAAANAAVTGVDATAVIVEVRQGGAMINYQPMIEVDLTVMPEGLPPYPVTVKQVASMVQLPQVRVGAIVHVKVDPNNPSAVWIDWTRIS
jgi:flagellar capping protein FliD